MIKYVILLVNMIAVLIMRMFFSQDITVKLSTPEKAKQGDEITVQILITKGDLGGIGHYKQELPVGFENATVIDAKGSDFIYLPKDNTVKFTWLSLPSDAEFTVSYKVKVGENTPNGKAILGGKFSYILNNVKQTYSVPDYTLLVGEELFANNSPSKNNKESSNVNNSTISNTSKQVIDSTKKIDGASVKITTVIDTTQPIKATTTSSEVASNPVNTTVAIQPQSPSIEIQRTIVGTPEAGTEFTIEVDVKKNSIKGFARIQEVLPQGLTALPLNNQGGTFSFIDQKVKIIWDNLPIDDNIKIAYRVLVPDNISGNMSVSGTFSYVENDDPKKIEINPTQIWIKPKEVLASTENNTTITTNTASTQVQIPINTSQENISASAITNIPSPDKKIAYKVQICALSKIQRGTSFFQTKYNIANSVSMEFHEGWRKYIVGKYSLYKDARDYRETVKNNGVLNPFVTAYNDNKRITVQEALMISNQQWIP